MEHALFIGNNCDVAFLFFSNLSRVCFPVICPYCIANIWQLSHLFQVGSWIDFRRLNSSFLSDLTDQRSIRVRVFRLRRSNETALAFFFCFFINLNEFFWPIIGCCGTVCGIFILIAFGFLSVSSSSRLYVIFVSFGRKNIEQRIFADEWWKTYERQVATSGSLVFQATVLVIDGGRVGEVRDTPPIFQKYSKRNQVDVECVPSSCANLMILTG